MMTRIFSQPVSQLSTDMDRLFDTLLNQTVGQPLLHAFPRAQVHPPMNAWEDDQNVYVEAEVPGLAMENIDLLVHNNQLTLRGQRQPAQQQGGLIRQERWHGQFERTITLPAPVDQEGAQASLQHGVLAVTLPKAASARPRKIEIKAIARQSE